MFADTDPTLDDMIRAAYRLSWPGPVKRRPRRVRRLIGGVLRLRRHGDLRGWPIALSTRSAV
ncbi:MAG TPA: hypothetical protein VK196_00380 [Magnetospirillum sp.]|nr:hypothetical protein [Magnetospirillum sp.]